MADVVFLVTKDWAGGVEVLGIGGTMDAAMRVAQDDAKNEHDEILEWNHDVDAGQADAGIETEDASAQYEVRSFKVLV